MYKISIIMPVYNDADLLAHSIDSFLKQTLEDIELICVNDGSVDDSPDILNGFAERYDSVRVLSQENQGSGKARNHGIQEARGEYIGFLDADDFFIDDDTLEKLYDAAVKNSAVMVSGNIKLVDEEGRFSPFRHLDYFTDYAVIQPEEYGIPWSFYKNIFKTDFIRDNGIEFPDLLRGQDPVFLAEILSKVDRIYAVPTDTYAYFYVNGANQCNTEKKRYDHMMHYKMVFDYLSDSRFDRIRHLFRYEMMGFINMMGVEGGKDILDATREIFKDDKKLLKDFEEVFYFKHEKDELKDLVEFKNNPDAPRISVVVNSEVDDNSFESISNQNFTDFEIIYSDSLRDDETIWNKANGEYIYVYNPDEVLKKNAFKQAYINALYNVPDLIMFNTQTDKFKNVNQRKFTFNYEYVSEYVLSAPFNFFRKEFLKDNDIHLDNLFEAIFKAEKMSYVKRPLGNVHLDYDIGDVEKTLKEMGLDELEDDYNAYQVNYLFNHIASKGDLNNAQERLKQVNVHNREHDLILNSSDIEEFTLKRDVLKLESQLEDYMNQFNKLSAKNHKLKKEHAELNKINEDIVESTSWKITKPLRKLKFLK